jgi:hypothetical protein
MHELSKWIRYIWKHFYPIMKKYQVMVLNTGLENFKNNTETSLTGLNSINVEAWKEEFFDTNSYQIGIDNHASAPMINTLSDFIQEPKPINVKIKYLIGHLSTTTKLAQLDGVYKMTVV